MGGSHIIRLRQFFTAAHLFSPFDSHDGARHSTADVRRRRNLQRFSPHNTIINELAKVELAVSS